MSDLQDVRIEIAELRGTIQTSLATMRGNIERAHEKTESLKYDLKTTKQSAHALHDRLDEFPPPDKVGTAVEFTNKMKAWLAGVAFGSGLVGGGVGAWIGAIMSGGPT